MIVINLWISFLTILAWIISSIVVGTSLWITIGVMFDRILPEWAERLAPTAMKISTWTVMAAFAWAILSILCWLI